MILILMRNLLKDSNEKFVNEIKANFYLHEIAFLFNFALKFFNKIS